MASPETWRGHRFYRARGSLQEIPRRRSGVSLGFASDVSGRFVLVLVFTVVVVVGIGLWSRGSRLTTHLNARFGNVFLAYWHQVFGGFIVVFGLLGALLGGLLGR